MGALGVGATVAAVAGGVVGAALAAIGALGVDAPGADSGAQAAKIMAPTANAFEDSMLLPLAHAAVSFALRPTRMPFVTPSYGECTDATPLLTAKMEGMVW